VSDRLGCLYTAEGLPVEELQALAGQRHSLEEFFLERILKNDLPVKFSSRQTIPARIRLFVWFRPHANYIDTDPSSIGWMIWDRAGNFVNMAAPIPIHPIQPEKLARPHERTLTGRKAPIASDFLVNSR
jgi:hypothetical protein